ncbi:MAG: nitrile hydratase accessory protein [Gammaproteobacteria bacterium]
MPDLPLDDEGPVFREPWEARAFALAVSLREQGVFTWNEWAEQLGKTIAAARAERGADGGDEYYRHWLACLESLVQRNGIATPESLAAGKQHAHEAHQRLHTHSS